MLDLSRFLFTWTLPFALAYLMLSLAIWAFEPLRVTDSTAYTVREVCRVAVIVNLIVAALYFFAHPLDTVPPFLAF